MKKNDMLGDMPSPHQAATLIATLYSRSWVNSTRYLYPHEATICSKPSDLHRTAPSNG